MKKILLLACAAFLFCLPMLLTAQDHGSCGTGHSDLLIERLKRNKKALADNIQFRDELVYVPIKFHLIAENDGDNRIPEKKVLEQLCTLNEFYFDQDIQFYIYEGFNYIDKTTAYENHSAASGNVWLQQAKVFNCLNIFIPKDANTGSASIGTTLGYYSPSKDWIVVRKQDISPFSQTLYHEVGHYFAMPHPFDGWDFDPWNATDHGNPVGPVSPDGVSNEKVDGSNCETAGDLICDTPADYNFFGWAGCNYSGGAMDPTGALLDPDESNIMNYFDDSCSPKYFSDDQKALIRADYNERTVLHTGWEPTATEVVGQSELIYPINEEVTQSNEIIGFEWTAVEGATHYLLEIDRLSDYTLDPKRVVVYNSTFATIDDHNFDSGDKYYWRIFPFNPYQTCTGPTANGRFEAGTGSVATAEIDAVKSWMVQPNPAQAGTDLNISLNAKSTFDAQVSLFDATGKEVISLNHTFTNGASNLVLPLSNVSGGLYMLNVRSGNEVMNKKVVITN